MPFGLKSLSLSETVVGIDVGERLVTAAQLDVPQQGIPDLRRAVWEALPENPTDTDVSTALRSLWQRGGLTSYTVCSCLRSPAAAVRHFRFPDLKKGELEAALWLEAEEILQIERQDILMDWQEYADPTLAAGAAAGAGREGVLVALPRLEVEAHLAVLDKAGLFPVVVDVACTAVSNLYCRLEANRPEGEAVCLVSLAERLADLAILYNGHAMYPRSLAMREPVWADGGDFLLSNLHDMLNYYRFKLRRKAVEQVLLTGDVPRDEAGLKRLEAGLGVPVKVWNPLSHVRVKAWKLFQTVKHDPRAGTVLAACMGMALRK